MQRLRVHEPDRQLVAQLLTGDPAAFQQFFDGYFPRLYRFILRRAASDADDIHDIVQATLIKGVRSLGSYRAEASLFTWLCQIARRELYDLQAKAATSRERLVQMEDDPSVRATLESLDWMTESSPDAMLQRADLAALVHAALDYLPGKYARILELKYVQELPVDDIAQELNLSPVSAQSLLARARNAFREACHVLSDRLDDFGVEGSAR